MISLQAHNQVWYHLTQITSAFSTRFVPLSVGNTRKNDAIAEKDVNKLCQISFLEAVKNYKELPIVDVNALNKIMLWNKKNNTWLLWNYPSVVPFEVSPRSSNKWKTSYISGNSFTENKHGFPCSEAVEPIILPAIYASTKQQRRFLHCLSNGAFNVQTRGFKTRRTIQTEKERNSFGEKLKKLFKKPAPNTNDFKNLLKTNNINMANAEEPHGKVTEESKYIEVIAKAYDMGFQSQMHTRYRTKFVNIVMFFVFLFMLSWFTGLYKIQGGTVLKGSVFSYKTEISPERINVTFNDVKGVQEAKEELQEIVHFLKNPQKFCKLGGKLPKGILLVGPPGTGKTLLARAVAGEAGVPFFYAGGPEFDELLVGQGARRVRDLFKAAREKAPCVVFLDEIDSIGGKRTSSVLHPYANQTVNQLLSEMDGFHKNEGVIILGATNRKDDLDRALMRPGRFDSTIYVSVPDFSGRKDIFELYLQNVPTEAVDTDYLAQCTVGFTGADIQNMVNQAALRAAIDGSTHVDMRHMEYARDKVIMGPARKALLLSQDLESRRITAYHEGGHALVAYYTKDAKPLHKVTIIPHGQSLGHTSYLHPKDRFHISKAELLAQLDSMMGGRAAEELIFGSNKITTGAGQDLQQATVVAEEMVIKHGMSDKVGLRSYLREEHGTSDYGPNANELIDKEVKRILQESYERAKAILKTHHEELKNIAEALLQHETLSVEDFKAIISGERNFEKYEKDKEPSMEYKI